MLYWWTVPSGKFLGPTGRLPPWRREFDRAGRLPRGDPGGQVGHQGAERKADLGSLCSWRVDRGVSHQTFGISVGFHWFNENIIFSGIFVWFFRIYMEIIGNQMGGALGYLEFSMYPRVIQHGCPESPRKSWSYRHDRRVPPGNLTLARRPIGFHDLPLKSADVIKIWPKNIGISPGYPMGRFLTHNENVSDPQGILKISQNQ